MDGDNPIVGALFSVFCVEQDTGLRFEAVEGDDVSGGEVVSLNFAGADVVASPTPVPMLSAPEVCALFGIGLSTLYARLAQDPEFPRPRKLGKSVRWLSSEIGAYQQQLPVAQYAEPSG